MIRRIVERRNARKEPFMSTKNAEPSKAQETGQRRRELAAIGERLVQSLGRPVDLREVRVWPLWEQHYRVNVLVGPDAASMRIAESFFLVADEDGNIIATDPKISKRY
jgi:hypothetical protein